MSETLKITTDTTFKFDIARYMKRKSPIVKPDEPFELYEIEIKKEP